LSSIPAPLLGAHVIKSTLSRIGLSADKIEEVILGNVVTSNVGQAPARQAAIHGGLPESVICTTINKVCASGMKAVMFASQAIENKANTCVLAGGFESMSNIPYYVPKGRTGYGYGHGQLLDGAIRDGLWDAFNDHHMGMCAEVCADTYKISRKEQDDFALESFRRAQAAIANGNFKQEIVPIEVSVKGKKTLVDTDENPAKVLPAKVPTLKPAFKATGSVTAANSSSLNDGAAALLVVSPEFARAHNLKPLARILGYADAAKAPVEFTTAPSLALPKAAARAGVDLKNIDYFEINQAFSVVSLANMKLLNLDPSRVDVNGGAVALGHPIGCSGARIIVTLINVLAQKNGSIGAAAICNGGGGASAIIIERL